jgi:hypothetical protein
MTQRDPHAEPEEGRAEPADVDRRDKWPYVVTRRRDMFSDGVLDALYQRQKKERTRP